MNEEFKLKSRSKRIDYLLGCLSGIIPHAFLKIEVLTSLYKEIEWEINNDERKDILLLFELANDKKNMVYSLNGWGRNRTYIHKEEFLNSIELKLRQILGKYKYYSLEIGNKDYQLGEE